jgi:hypothetical protein
LELEKRARSHARSAREEKPPKEIQSPEVQDNCYARLLREAEPSGSSPHALKDSLYEGGPIGKGLLDAIYPQIAQEIIHITFPIKSSVHGVGLAAQRQRRVKSYVFGSDKVLLGDGGCQKIAEKALEVPAA